MKIDQSTINFAVYEDANEFCGLAKITLPDISYITQSISGAGIAGNIDAVIMGHIDAMNLGINYRTTTMAALKLLEPRRHNIDLRAAQQVEDTVVGRLQTQKIKHVLVVEPKKYTGGTIAPASPTDASGEFAVRSWACFIDGKKKLDIDPMNMKCEINGVDYLADTRKALGK